VDPAGNELDLAMPRYSLDSAAAQDLVAYLKRLGSDDSDHGVASKQIIVAAMGPAVGLLAGVGSVVERLLSGYFHHVNQGGGIYNRHVVLRTATFDSSGSAVEALRRLMDKTEVFAVVAPLALGQDAVFIEFTEGSGLPVIGPRAHHRRSAVRPPDFTFYLTADIDDQTRVLARYAQNHLAAAHAKMAILLVQRW